MKRVLGIIAYILLLPFAFFHRFAHRKVYLCEVCGAEAYWPNYGDVTVLECSMHTGHEGFREVEQ